MMDIEKIIELIRLEVDEEYTDIEITPDTDLKEELQFTSLNMLVVMNEIEEQYGVEINADDLRFIRTIRDIEKLLD
jgi:acyl carrier protein